MVRRFLGAYGHFKANRALKLLTEDTIVSGSGWPGGWGSRERFRSELAYMKAQGVKQIVNGCEEQGESGDGVSVRCAFDYHVFRSDEVGLGPYTRQLLGHRRPGREDHLGRGDLGLHDERLLGREVGALPGAG